MSSASAWMSRLFLLTNSWSHTHAVVHQQLHEVLVQVAEELTAKDVIRAHARDELGIDLDDMTNPYQAAAASAVAFVVGAGIPLLAAAFISDAMWRIISVVSFLHASDLGG
jgi:VIT1/CCC1 family predicted Fe2+/Mn2+ transporter